MTELKERDTSCLNDKKLRDNIMKNIKFKKASIRDLDQIRTLYWRLLDSSPEYGRILQWKKNIIPKYNDWNNYNCK